MKLLRFTLIISAFILCFVSCGGEEEDFADSGSSSEKSCESSFDCPLGYTCDTEKKVCTDGSDSSDTAHHDGGDTANPDETDSVTGDTAPGPQDGDNDPITGSCEPGKKQT